MIQVQKSEYVNSFNICCLIVSDKIYTTITDNIISVLVFTILIIKYFSLFIST